MPLIRVSDSTYEILKSLKEKFGTFDNAISSLVRHNHTEQLDLSYNIPPEKKVLRTEHYVEAPFDGEIIHVEITIPTGAGNLVQVKMGVNEFDRLAEVTTEGHHPLPVSYPIRMKDRIWAEISNYSTTYTYPVSILVIVREMPRVLVR